MKRLLLAAAAAATLVCSANAADMSVKANRPAAIEPAYVNWQGGYVDIYFRYGANIDTANLSIDTVSSDIASSPHGPGVGGSLGYWIDTGSLVWGPRVDISYLDLTGSGQIGNGSLRFSNATNYLGNADLCLGLPLSADRRLLAYGCGGFAFGGAKPQFHIGDTLAASTADTSVGWNIAGGLRYQLPKSFPIAGVVFIEGDYSQLGDKTLTCPVSLCGEVVATSNVKYHIVSQKAGISIPLPF